MRNTRHYHIGKVTETQGINLPNNNIKGLNLDETYKDLGILRADDIKHTSQKEDIKRIQ